VICAEVLERRLKRIAELEPTPIKVEIEVKPPMPRFADRRYRRFCGALVCHSTVSYPMVSHRHSAAHSACGRSGGTISLAQQVPPLACPLEFGAVPRYRFKISWSVPTYRLDWVVLGYSKAEPQASPRSPCGLERRSPHIPLGW